MKRAVVLDDYQNVALRSADWSVLDGRVAVDTINHHIGSAAELIDQLKDYEIVVAMRERTAFPRSILESLPKLELFVTTGPVNAVLDLDACAGRNITVCGTRGFLPPAMEQTWALILATAKRVCECDRTIKAGLWQTVMADDLIGARLGLIGLGRYGSRVAHVAKAFEMEIVAWSQNLTAERCAEVGGVTLVSKEELLSTSDIVSIHLVLSSRTTGLIGEPDLRMMKKTAHIVNTSRGPIIDDAALTRALREHWIAGAGIDVFAEEPLPLDHPFRSLDNIVLTPHMGYVTPYSYKVFYQDVVDDIVGYLDGNLVRQLITQTEQAPHGSYWTNV
jgi:phosphoglycerate dehydrogenase-like enzyme